MLQPISNLEDIDHVFSADKTLPAFEVEELPVQKQRPAADQTGFSFNRNFNTVLNPSQLSLTDTLNNYLSNGSKGKPAPELPKIRNPLADPFYQPPGAPLSLNNVMNLPTLGPDQNVSISMKNSSANLKQSSRYSLNINNPLFENKDNAEFLNKSS